MAVLLLLLVLFAGCAVFLLLVLGIMVLFGAGPLYALIAIGIAFLGLSLLGGTALSAISQRLPAPAPRWSRLVGSGWMALAVAIEFGASIALWSTQ